MSYSFCKQCTGAKLVPRGISRQPTSYYIGSCIVLVLQAMLLGLYLGRYLL